jgi:hypothetical protein
VGVGVGSSPPAARVMAFQIMRSSFTSEGILRVRFSSSLNCFENYKIGHLKAFAKGLSCTIDSHLSSNR